MSNVIDFAAALNARRATAIVDAREAAKAARIAAERQDIADKLGGTIGAQIIADVVTDLRAKEEAASAPKFVPAYCDPHNDVRGSKYEATKGLPLTEVAKRMRADIKALGLCKGVKVSVRVRHHNAIDVEVTGLPEGFKVMSEKAASWRKQFGRNRDYPFAWVDARSAELASLLDSLNAIHGAYNRNNSDSMSDYFDVRFYGSANIDWRVRDAHEAREIEAASIEYWAA